MAASIGGAVGGLFGGDGAKKKTSKTEATKPVEETSKMGVNNSDKGEGEPKGAAPAPEDATDV